MEGAFKSWCGALFVVKGTCYNQSFPCCVIFESACTKTRNSVIMPALRLAWITIRLACLQLALDDNYYCIVFPFYQWFVSFRSGGLISGFSTYPSSECSLVVYRASDWYVESPWFASHQRLCGDTVTQDCDKLITVTDIIYGIPFRKELVSMLKTQEPPPSLRHHNASIPAPTRNSPMKCAYHPRVKSLRKRKRSWRKPKQREFL